MTSFAGVKVGERFRFTHAGGGVSPRVYLKLGARTYRAEDAPGSNLPLWVSSADARVAPEEGR